MIINEFMQEVHRNAVEHGFWEDERPIEEIIALIHSEWSEALEEYRADRPMVWYECKEIEHAAPHICTPKDVYDCLNYGTQETCSHRCKKPEGIAVELIDGCIRIFDYIGKRNANISTINTMQELMGAAPEATYKISLARLVANMHLKTSQAYTFLLRTDDALEFEQRGLAILFEAVAVSCAWISDQGLDPEKLMLEKHEYNKSRPYKHGKKC